MNIPLEGVNLDKSSAPLTNITVDLDALTKGVDSVTVDNEFLSNATDSFKASVGNHIPPPVSVAFLFGHSFPCIHSLNLARLNIWLH